MMFCQGSFLPKFQTNTIHFRWLLYFNIFLRPKETKPVMQSINGVRFNQSSKQVCCTIGRRNDVPHWFVARKKYLPPFLLRKEGQFKLIKIYNGRRNSRTSMG